MTTPMLQLALDTFDLPSALSPMQRAMEHIDVVEAGTILCLSEGMHAVRALRALYPDKVLLADMRIAEAGSIIAKLAFDAGADWVTVVSGASDTTMSVVLAEARSRGRHVQLEMLDGWTMEQARRWRELGFDQVIFHRSRDGEAVGELSWKPDDFDDIRRLHEMGLQVTIAGGVEVKDLELFEGVPVQVFTVGRAIRGAEDPGVAARAFKSAIRKAYGS